VKARVQTMLNSGDRGWRACLNLNACDKIVVSLPAAMPPLTSVEPYRHEC